MRLCRKGPNPAIETSDVSPMVWKSRATHCSHRAATTGGNYNAVPEDVEQLLELIGLRPIIVPDLPKSAIVLPEWDLVLMDAALCVDQMRDVANRCLAVAAADLRAVS